MKQDDPDIAASQDPDPESGGGKRRLSCALKWILGVIFLTMLISGSTFWGVESWMLGESFWRIEKRIPLTVAVGGGLGCTGVMILLDFGRHRLRRAILGLAISLAIIGSMRWAGGELALGHLMRSWELTGTFPTMPDSFSQRVVAWMEGKHVSVPAWLKKRAENPRQIEDPPRMHRLVSCSRWPVRREFVRRMLMDEKHAAYLVGHWDDCFAAVTGVDVDLAHRRDLMAMFSKSRENRSLSENSRQAATLWMGLVFLTDPVEFVHWREPIRDAMLGITGPIQAQHHDCWMRVLDTLLAYDPPESWPAATKALTSNPITLRRAVRERVRGVMSHFDAIVREFDASEHSADWDAAFALWQDAGRWLAAYPNTAEDVQVRQWRQTTMFRWLETDGLGTTWKQLYNNNEILVNLTAEDVIDLTSEQEAILNIKARDWTDQSAARSVKATATSDSEEAHVALEHARVLLPFLADDHQKDLVRRMTPALIRPGTYVTRCNQSDQLPEYRSCDRCRSMLEKSWHQISPEDLKFLVKNMRPLWSPRRIGAWPLCLDAWSGNPEFSDEEWLLYAIAEDKIWKSTPADTPRHLVEIVPRSRLPVPPVSDEVADKVIAILDAAIWKPDGQMLPMDDVRSNFDKLYPDRPFSPATLKWLIYKLRKIRAMFRSKDSGDFATSMQMELNLAGLTEANETLMATFAQRARNDRRLYDSLRPWHPDPWRGVLDSPIAARQCLADLIGKDRDRRLQGLLSSAVRTPPADDVVQAMWQELRLRADCAEPWEKTRIYGALFHLAPLVSETDQLSMRSDFLEYFRKTPIPVNQWPNQAMDDVWLYREFYANGEGIPWQDDSLSAALSWSSDVGIQIDLMPVSGVAETSTGVFSYLAQAMVSYSFDGLEIVPINRQLPIDVLKRQPLRPPFEATPWQKARHLHLRRPDLHFPDHAWARPRRRDS